MYDDIALAIENQFPSLRATLEDLIRMPSVSAAGYDAAEVRRSAEFTADLLRSAGFDAVQLLEHEGAHPAVYGQMAGPAGAPTVLLYAHHDVQPPGPDEEWHTAPFEPIVRDGRIYGRGSSDDAGGIIVHLGAVGAFDGKPPVGVKVIIEGEEEIGSLHLEDFLAEHADMLAADVIVIADSGNWKTGQPSLTTSLRGLVDCTVEVRTLDNAVHSGMFGGTVPDAVISLARLISTLHNDDGSVAIPGLVSGDADPLDLTEADVRDWSGAVDGVELIGNGGLTARMWTQPSISVLAVDAPPVSEAINQLVPVATAKISMRLAPGDDPQRAMTALVSHLEDNAPWGAQLTVTPGAAGEAFALDTTGPAYDAFRTAFREAWDTEPNEIGVGGSIPFVAAFSERYPDATILLTGVADHLSRAHGPDESLDLDDLKKGTIAEAIALRLLAE